MAEGGEAFFNWLNSLCSALHKKLEQVFNKQFIYDFQLAQEAVQNSIRMWHEGEIGHFYHDETDARFEVVACASINCSDMQTLQEIVDSWLCSPGHTQALSNHSVIGVGLSYSSGMIYATARLR